MTGPPAMTHPMIERCARALARHNYPSGSERDIDDMWDGWAEEVRIVFQAAREPTEDMIEAGNLSNYDQSGDTQVDAIWTAMLDRTLTETPSAGEQ